MSMRSWWFVLSGKIFHFGRSDVTNFGILCATREDYFELYAISTLPIVWLGRI